MCMHAGKYGLFTRPHKYYYMLVLFPDSRVHLPEKKAGACELYSAGHETMSRVTYLVYMCILYAVQLTSVKELSTASITMSIGVV